MKIINSIQQLRDLSFHVRKDVIRSLAEAGSGHLGGSLGLADIFTVLYFNILNHDPQRPDWKDRDRLILSIGHVAPVLYASLARAGYFPIEELQTLRKLGSRLQGHPGKDHGLPGLELSAGSLGQGLSVAVGTAISGKIDNKTWRVYSIHGDGELQEGSIWEAAMSAAHYKLDNLVSLVDRNNVQIDGNTKDVMDLEPLADKWKSFGWHVLNCNGHDHKDIILAYEQARKTKDKPTVILAKTHMGKGVRSIEDNHTWHGKAPSAKQADKFIKELEQNSHK
ncbi:MAG: transketolase [Bacteroidetes bacterium]|nr:transketolase [Bacteroidota bacterium]